MKKRPVDIIIGIVFILGLGILLYPAVSNYINEKHSTRVIKSYSDTVENTGSDELEKILHDAEDYNRRLSEKPEAFFNPDIISGYRDVLDITGSGIMGYIAIDKIGVELPIYHGVEKEEVFLSEESLHMLFYLDIEVCPAPSFLQILIRWR